MSVMQRSLERNELYSELTCVLNSLQVSVGVSLGDERPVLAWVSHSGRSPCFQGLAAPLPPAEAGDRAAVPSRDWPPPAGELCIQPESSVAAALPPCLHQTLHGAPGPAGFHRRPAAAAVGSSAVVDSVLVDGGGGGRGRGETCEEHGERALSAAAGRSPPGLSAPPGSAGTGSHPGVPLASADSQVQDLSPSSALLQSGLDAGAVRTGL